MATAQQIQAILCGATILGAPHPNHNPTGSSSSSLLQHAGAARSAGVPSSGGCYAASFAGTAAGAGA